MKALEQVAVGMRVVDAGGHEIGKVHLVKAADPKAAAFEARLAAAPGSLINLGLSSIAGREPKVPPEMAVRLFREGYIKIDAEGFFGTDSYAAGDVIDRVDQRTVHLTLTRHELDALE